MKLLALFLFMSAAFQRATALGKDTCFGKDPDFDKQCAAFTTEAKCQAQVACLWGNAGETDCFAKNGDPVIDRLCKKITNATLCAGQVGCTWRSDADNARWVTAINAGVSALAVSAPTLPSTIALGSPSYVSAHDHKQVAVANLPATLNAWVAKYGLPTSVATGLKALVAADSADYKSYHVALSGGTGVLDEVAAGGRNWGGVVSLAFVHARATSAITKYYINVDCKTIIFDVKVCVSGKNAILVGGKGVQCTSKANCVHLSDPGRALGAAEVQSVTKQLQAWSYPKLTAENVLLKDEILGPTRTSLPRPLFTVTV